MMLQGFVHRNAHYAGNVFLLMGLLLGLATLLKLPQNRNDEVAAITMASSLPSTMTRPSQFMQPVMARQPMQRASAFDSPVVDRAGPAKVREASARAGAATAVGTIGEVAPKNTIDEGYDSWGRKYRSLISRGLTPVNGEEAMRMVKEDGAVIVDVRTEEKFNEGTVDGAIHVPLFQSVKPESVANVMQIMYCGVLGCKATKGNANFGTLALERLPRDKPLVIVCQRGGILDTDPAIGFKIAKDTAKYTTSLKAAYELYEAGFTNLYYVVWGINMLKEAAEE